MVDTGHMRVKYSWVVCSNLNRDSTGCGHQYAEELVLGLERLGWLLGPPDPWQAGLLPVVPPKSPEILGVQSVPVVNLFCVGN